MSTVFFAILNLVHLPKIWPEILNNLPMDCHIKSGRLIVELRTVRWVAMDESLIKLIKEAEETTLSMEDMIDLELVDFRTMLEELEGK